MNSKTKNMYKSYNDLLKQFCLMNLSKEKKINENKGKDKTKN